MKNREMMRAIERESAVPDKLQPDRIKDMLDEMGKVRPIIGGEEKPQVKLTSRSGVFIRVLCTAAVFLLAAGSVFLLDSIKDPKVGSGPAAQPPKTAQTQGLSGIRGASYRSLYSRLSAAVDTFDLNVYALDTTRVMTPDSEKEYDYALQMAGYFRNYMAMSTSAEKRVISQDSDRVTGSYEEFSLLARTDSVAFSADYTQVRAYQLSGKDSSPISNDITSDLKIRETLSENTEYKERSHTPEIYIIGLCCQNDRLYALYGFFLPESIEGHLVIRQYTGLAVYDAADAQHISLLYEYEQPGDPRSVRLESSGALTLASCLNKTKDSVVYSGFDESGSFLPHHFQNGEKQLTPEDCIYVSNRSKSSCLSYVTKFMPDSDTNALKKVKEAVIALDSPQFMEAAERLLVFGQIGIDSEDSQMQLLAIDTTDNNKLIAEAQLTDISDDLAMYATIAFGENEENYYISDGFGVSVISKDLCQCYTARERYTRDDADDRSYASAFIDGSKVYYCTTYFTAEGEIPICREICDLSEPTKPVYTELSVGDTSSAVLDANTFILNDTTAARLEEVFENNELKGAKAELLGLDPHELETSEAMTFILQDGEYKPDTENLLTYPSPKVTLQSQQMNMDAACDSLAPPNSQGFKVGFSFDEQAGLLFIPIVHTEEDSVELQGDDFDTLSAEDSQNVRYDWDKESKVHYYYVNSVTQTVKVFALDIATGEIRGEFEAGSTRGDTAAIQNQEFCGAFVHEGAVCAFSSSGAAFTPIE